MTAASCFAEESGFAWNHGDFQNQITHTWLGMVGPGVRNLGRFGEIFTDHTDIRPTLIGLAGLKDDYSHDGRMLFEVLKDDAIPDAVRDQQFLLSSLASALKDINAPRGLLGRKTLTGIATHAVEADDATYAALDERINDITRARNGIANEMLAMLEGAEFQRTPVDPVRAAELILEARLLLGSADF